MDDLTNNSPATDAGEIPDVIRMPAPDPDNKPILVSEPAVVPGGLEKADDTGHWSVELKPSPARVVKAKSDAHAVKAYMKAMGISHSVHRFMVAEVDAKDVPEKDVLVAG